jgi:hypothetical protein
MMGRNIFAILPDYVIRSRVSVRDTRRMRVVIAELARNTHWRLGNN